MKKERVIGIDFLRILSMIFIVILHVLGQGGIIKNCELHSTNYMLAWLLEILAFCSVNCYGIISGYVGTGANFKYSNILKQWIKVVFYTLSISTIFFSFLPKTRTITNIVKAFFPVLFNEYWYFTAYFCMFFFIPYLNKLLNSLNRIEAKNLIILIIFFFSTFCLISPVDIFNLASGYSLIWLTILYLIGGYIKKYGLFTNWSTKKLTFYFFMTMFITWGSKVLTEMVTLQLFNQIKGNLFLIRYNSITILFEGIFLFLICLRLDLTKFKKIITILAPLSFSVYLIHTNPLIWQYLMKDRFINFINYSPFKFLSSISLATLSIYLISILIDYLRSKIFQLLKIDDLCINMIKKSNKILSLMKG